MSITSGSCGRCGADLHKIDLSTITPGGGASRAIPLFKGERLLPLPAEDSSLLARLLRREARSDEDAAKKLLKSSADAAVVTAADLLIRHSARAEALAEFLERHEGRLSLLAGEAS